MKADDKELLMAMADQVRLLGFQMSAQQIAMESLLRLLPPAAKQQCAAEFRAHVDDLLGSMDDLPMSDDLRAGMTLPVNAILEALGQPPGQPGTR